MPLATFYERNTPQITVEELLYGDTAEYRATCDHHAGEIVRVNSRYGVVQSHLHKGDLTEVICSSPFVYECSADYSVGEGDPVHFDLRRKSFVATTNSSLFISTALDYIARTLIAKNRQLVFSVETLGINGVPSPIFDSLTVFIKLFRSPSP